MIFGLIGVGAFVLVLLGQFITMGVLNAKEAALRAELERVRALEEQYMASLSEEELKAYLLQKLLEAGYGTDGAPYLQED